MTAQGSSRTVLFDVGGVLVDTHPDPHAIAELFGDGSRGLTTLVDHAMWAHRGEYDAGMSDREFWDRIAGDCGQPEPSSALLKELVALDASRMATPIAKAIRRSEWGSLFDFFAFSCDYGICKPSRGIYRDVLVRLAMPHEDVVFIDDRRENVRAAELLGVKGIVWQGVEDAEARLKELGVLF